MSRRVKIEVVNPYTDERHFPPRLVDAVHGRYAFLNGVALVDARCAPCRHSGSRGAA